MSNPVPNSTTSFWRAKPHELENHHSTEELPQKTDILIIGSGYSGAACSYYLTKDGPFPAPSITILEAREVCSGATGRNGGHIKPDMYYGMSKYTKLYGPEAAASIARFELNNVFAVKELVEKENIDCDFHLTRAADVFIDAQAAKDAEVNYKQIMKDGAVDLHDVHYIDRNAEAITGVQGAISAFTFTAGQLWPYNLITSLLKLAMSRGNVNLQTHTPVTSLSAQPNENGYYQVSTPRGTISAKKVLVCTNAYTASLIPGFKSRVIPCRGIAARIITPPNYSPPRLAHTYALRGEKGLMDYLIQRPSDGSIVVGGARSAFIRDLNSWYGSVNDSELINTAAEGYFENYMQRHFVEWKDSNAHVDRIWTGVMGYSADACPFVGSVPDTGKGIWVMAGFTGHGMPQILGCAKALVDEVVMDMKPGSWRDKMQMEDWWKGLKTLPPPFQITGMRMQSKTNLILDDWGRTWEEKAKL